MADQAFPRSANGDPVIGIVNAAGDAVPVSATAGLPTSQGAFQRSSGFVLQNAAAATGNGNIFDVTGMATVILDMVLTGTATLITETSYDGGTTWHGIPVMRLSNGQIFNSPINSGRYVLPVTGFDLIRARISAYTSGTVTVTGYSSPQVFWTPYVTLSGSTAGAANTLGTGTVDGQAKTAGQATWNQNLVLNGSNTWDLMRAAAAAADTAGSGLLGAGLLGWDTTNSLFRRLLADANGRLAICGGQNTITDGDTNSPLGFHNSGSTVSKAVAASQFLWSGSGHVKAREVNTFRSNQSTGTGAGGDLTLWTPTTGKRFRVFGVFARASIAGRYELRDGSGNVLAFFYQSANSWTRIFSAPANGYLSLAANNQLLLRNQSGSASDMDALVFGCEE